MAGAHAWSVQAELYGGRPMLYIDTALRFARGNRPAPPLLTPSFGPPKSPSVATYRKVKGLPMSDVRTSRLGDSAEQRSCQAIIMKGFKGHTVTLTIHEDTQVRVIVDKTVESYREAETIARAFAAQQGFPWHKVAVVSR